MKRILMSAVCVMALSACATGGPFSKKADGTGQKFDVTAKQPNATDVAADMAAMPRQPIETDPNVQVYSMSGPAVNPLNANPGPRSPLDNTTAGGYTVFDDSVTVYPLPGETAPAFLPTYAVPPLESQYKEKPAMVGKPMGLASAGILPPVKNVEVPDADPYAKPPVAGKLTSFSSADAPAPEMRKPLTLTAPGPVTMQPPASARPPMASPFKGAPAPLTATAISKPEPTLTAPDDFADIPPPKPVTPTMNAGRKSSPLLTGY